MVMPRLVRNIGDGYSFPLGVPYVSASMKKAGCNVIPLNLNHRHGDVADILRRAIEEHHIDIVATGGLSFQYNSIRTVVKTAKEANGRITTIVGGGIITSDAETAMEALEYVDYGVIGEGEITAPALCQALEQGTDVAAVDGLIYKTDAGYKRTQPRKELQNIDEVPWPDYEGFELGSYLAASPSISGLNRKKTIFMLTSRSCPYNCTFCFHTTGRKYRQRSLDNFFQELDYLVSRYDIEFICLADELFGHNIERVKEFCERIRGYKVQWWAQFRVDQMSEELLQVLKAGGCQVMSFGLESADNRVLKSMRKGTTVEQMERTLAMVYKSGVSLEGAFIFGDIAETWETANNTLKWWRDHAEYRINLNLITVYPGSYLYQYACENGIITDKVQFLRGGCPQVNVSKLTPEEVSELVKSIMEAPLSLIKTLSTVKVRSADYQTGRLDVAGVCVACGKTSDWNDAKFLSPTFLACKHCGQKYSMVLPGELRANIDRNVTKLIEKHGKVAIWGINYQTAELFKYSDVLRNPNVYPIDISNIKRLMILYGKQIFPPEAIDSEGIDAVVVGIPAFFGEIEGQVRANPQHRSKKVIDITRLADPNYEVQ
jgi:radical SAM superfamily enzyme YgiQ (UPF0313 family)